MSRGVEVNSTRKEVSIIMSFGVAVEGKRRRNEGMRDEIMRERVMTGVTDLTLYAFIALP